MNSSQCPPQSPQQATPRILRSPHGLLKMLKPHRISGVMRDQGAVNAFQLHSRQMAQAPLVQMPGQTCLGTLASCVPALRRCNLARRKGSRRARPGNSASKGNKSQAPKKGLCKRNLPRSVCTTKCRDRSKRPDADDKVPKVHGVLGGDVKVQKQWWCHPAQRWQSTTERRCTPAPADRCIYIYI